MRILTDAQAALQALYHLEGMPSVIDFLMGETQARTLLGEAFDEDQSQVIAHWTHDQLDLGVYFTEDVVEHLESNTEAFLELNAYGVLVEELSHFLYLIWNAQNDMPVSLLDLEMQGEVDKFLLFTDRFDVGAQELVERMFHAPKIHEGMPPDVKARYESANHLAHGLARSMLSETDGEDASQIRVDVGFLRSYYRQSSPRRLKYAQLQAKKNLAGAETR